MDIGGPIGSIGSYEVSIDASLNLILSVKFPLASVINGEVAKENSPILTEIVTLLEQAAAAYVAAQPAVPAAGS